MSLATYRLLSYAGTTVTADWSGEEPARIADFLFGAFPAPPPASDPPVARYHLGPAPDSGRLLLSRDGVDVWEGEDPGAAAEAWLGAVSHELAWHSRGGLLFHAGALAAPGGAVVLPGAIGAGKTTLSLWLAARGLDYGTDEMVFVPDGTTTAVPCRRPLNLKAGSLEALRGVFDVTARPDAVLLNPQGCLVAPALLGKASEDQLAWARVVLPHFEAGAAFALEPLTPARAGLELMQCLVNARNLPGHGFDEVIRLARAAPAWSLRYSSFDQLGPLEELLRKS